MSPVGGLNNVIGIAAGGDHALAVRTGPATLVVTLEPTDQYQLGGGEVTFSARGAGLYGVTYQWQFDGTNISGATDAVLTLTNVQAAEAGVYNVMVTGNGGTGSIASSNASFVFVTPPVITSQTLPTSQLVNYTTNVTLSVEATAPAQTNGFPLSYQWQFDGTNIAWATQSNYTFSAVSSGTYSVVVSNAAGSTNVSWQVTVLVPGNVWAWGDNQYGECTVPLAVTNILGIAAGQFHCVAIEDNGTVIQWGYNWGDVPADLTNAVAVAAGYEHSIALRSDGTVETWGATNADANYVPEGLMGVKAVAAGWFHNVALLTNGTVTAWGEDLFGVTDVPTGLTNAIAISAQTLHSLAVQRDGTVVAWGDDSEGESDVPAGLSNVVAVAAGAVHSLALKADGTVVAWGYNGSGQTNVPVGLSNVMAIAAGAGHSVALLNDGTVVAWGDDSAGQTDTPALSPVKLIAAGGYFTLAGLFSPFVQYPVDVTKDLLLIYNTNSSDSTTVFNYYLGHRPLVSGANVLGIGCPTNEVTDIPTFTNQILAPVQGWLAVNPTKHPQYLILFPAIPSRVWFSTNCSSCPIQSVAYGLYTNFSSIPPFITSINMGLLDLTNDCIAYINKLEEFGTNYSSGKLTISASSGGYENTNWLVDDVSYAGPAFYWITNALLAAGVPAPSITYVGGVDPCILYDTNGNCLQYGSGPHITNAVNVASYFCWGAHSALGSGYAMDGVVHWSRNSSWWIIETDESFNGIRGDNGQGRFTEWFSSTAFGGTNYENAPVGAVSNTDEPGGIDDAGVYFGLWASGKSFAICAWNCRRTQHFQAVGDPFVRK